MISISWLPTLILFINELSNHAVDWQVMVVTEDDGCSNYSGILTPNTPNYQALFTKWSESWGQWRKHWLTERLVQMAQVAIDNTDAGVQCWISS